MTNSSAAQPIWQPDEERKAQTNLTSFMVRASQSHGLDLPDYAAVYDWSVQELEAFWEAVWQFCGVIGERGNGPVLEKADQMPGARFFPGAEINFAENLLRRSDDSEAIVFWGEEKAKTRLTWAELNDQVGRLSRALAAEGVSPGDRVAGFVPNRPEAVIAMLATASLGAIWSSCSPDFGVQGVLDRFGQIEPKVLICPDGYYYNGKTIDSLERVAEFAAQLPSLRRIIVFSYIGSAKLEKGDVEGLALGVSWDKALDEQVGGPPSFQAMAFNDPLFIMYSSGTTGKPKCIVHGIGGTLIQHLKELVLQCDVKPNDRVFYFTTCGWMMWNWQVSALAAGATLLLYDGSPFAPDGNILFDYMQAERCTLFGTSAKYIDALGKSGLAPIESHNLSSIRTVTSTGSPLLPEGFDTVYSKIKHDVCLSSIAGGTDIIGCFMGGNPIGPVWRGEIQARHLAMAVEVYDDQGRAIRGEKGELVCTKPFPSMPVGFWNDPGDQRYRAAYFETYPGVWHHGDFVELTEHDGLIIYGRSDATLNPGGVRIGTAEIYRQVEQMDAVEEGIVIGQDWQGDLRIVLFVKLRPGRSLDDQLVADIKARIRAGCTPRHVPAKVLQVEDIPRTKSGKITELAVRDVVHGRAVKNKEALANPEALAYFAERAELTE